MRIIELSDLSDPALDIFARLTEAQLRSRREREKGVFIAESAKVIRLALDAGYVPVAFLMEGRHITGQAGPLLERCPDVPVYTAPREVLAQLTGYELTRGMLCALRRPEPVPVERVCRGARRLAVLENVVDATNVGAVFRSAAALGMDGVLVTSTCCDPLNRRCVRVSMGTVFQIPWGVLEGEDWPRQLREQGFTTVALALTDRSLPIHHPELAKRERLAIVLGAEGDGLSPATVAQCDYTARIPMGNGVDSLNVAAAGAVAFWQLRPAEEG